MQWLIACLVDGWNLTLFASGSFRNLLDVMLFVCFFCSSELDVVPLTWRLLPCEVAFLRIDG